MSGNGHTARARRDGETVEERIAKEVARRERVSMQQRQIVLLEQQMKALSGLVNKGKSRSPTLGAEEVSLVRDFG